MEELIGPFRGERGAGYRLRPGVDQGGNALPFAALAFILAVTAAGAHDPGGDVYHLMFLGLAGIAFAGGAAQADRDAKDPGPAGPGLRPGGVRGGDVRAGRIRAEGQIPEAGHQRAVLRTVHRQLCHGAGLYGAI